MKIRDFSEIDFKYLIALLDEFLDYTRDTYSEEVLEFNDFIDSKKEDYISEILKTFRSIENSKFLVAEKDSKVIGYIIGFIETNSSVVMQTAGHIKSFFVSKDCREGGIGKELYNSLVLWFKENNCDHLNLEVHDGNEKTIAMYKKWGFKENSIKMKKKL